MALRLSGSVHEGEVGYLRIGWCYMIIIIHSVCEGMVAFGAWDTVDCYVKTVLFNFYR
jgi:hypothetical protein